VKAEGAAQIDFLGHQQIHRQGHLAAAQSQLNDHAGRARGLQGAGQGHGAAGRFESDVEIALVGFVPRQGLGIACGIQRVVGTDPAGGQPVLAGSNVTVFVATTAKRKA